MAAREQERKREREREISMSFLVCDVLLPAWDISGLMTGRFAPPYGIPTPHTPFFFFISHPQNFPFRCAPSEFRTHYTLPLKESQCIYNCFNRRILFHVIIYVLPWYVYTNRNLFNNLKKFSRVINLFLQFYNSNPIEKFDINTESGKKFNLGKNYLYNKIMYSTYGDNEHKLRVVSVRRRRTSGVLNSARLYSLSLLFEESTLNGCSCNERGSIGLCSGADWGIWRLEQDI